MHTRTCHVAYSSMPCGRDEAIVPAEREAQRLETERIKAAKEAKELKERHAVRRVAHGCHAMQHSTWAAHRPVQRTTFMQHATCTCHTHNFKLTALSGTGLIAVAQTARSLAILHR